jgi:hypothetical protein
MAAGRVGEGWIEKGADVRILHLEGSPYEIGYQHGVLLREEIRNRIRDRLLGSLMEQDHVSHLLMLRHGRRVDARLSSEYRAELAGIADGAGVAYSQVLLLNTYGDLIAQQWPDRTLQDLALSLSPPFAPFFGPSDAPRSTDSHVQSDSSGTAADSRVRGAFAVFGAVTRDGNLLQAVDFESPALRPEELIIMVYRPEEGNSFVAVGTPGAVGVTVGLNEEQVSVTVLPSPSQDVSIEGVPLPFVMRDVLQYARDIPAALRILASADRTTGHNVLVGDGKRPDAQVVELATHLYAVFESEGNFVARTQHYLDANLAQTQRSLSWWPEEDSWEHLDALLTELEADYGRLDAAGAVRLIQQLPVGPEASQSAADDVVVRGVVLVVSDLEIRLVTDSGDDPGPVVSLDEEF